MGDVGNKKEKDKSEGFKRTGGRARETEGERKREECTAGELRQSIRLPGPKKLEPGFAE